MEIDCSRDPQQEECGYDSLSVEIYPGETYWEGSEFVFADPGSENYDSRNGVIATLVENLGTRYILEALGYDKKIAQ